MREVLVVVFQVAVVVSAVAFDSEKLIVVPVFYVFVESFVVASQTFGGDQLVV
jgi:hypothetical protein